jgi:hypothetical protein
MAAALHTHLSKAKASAERKGQETMNKRMTLVIVAALLTAPPFASAADKCPTELSEAKAMLSKASASTKKSAPPSGQDVQAAPRQLAGAKSQDIQAPRAQDIQAPRAQDVQAPRAQDIQAPRAQDVQAPRAQDIQAPRSPEEQAARVTKARKLIADAEAACKKGDMALSANKASEAKGLLK